MSRRVARLWGRGPMTGFVTVVVLLGVIVGVFFTPVWISFEQRRSGAAEITGYSRQDVDSATGAILADLFFGGRDFTVQAAGRPLLDASERSHMLDVRAVLRASSLVFGVSLALLATLVIAFRRRRWLWRSIARAGGVLAGVALGGVVVGLFFFDQAFLLFHLIFFPQGNFEFDPRSERLPQLFPEQFWVETVMAMVVVAIVLGTIVAVAASAVARRRPD